MVVKLLRLVLILLLVLLLALGFQRINISVLFLFGHALNLSTLQVQEFIKIYFLSTIVSWFLVPKLVRAFEKRTILLFSLIIIGIFQATPFILYKIGLIPEFGTDSLVYFLSVFIFITGTFSVMSLMTRESMVPDMIDQVQKESKLRPVSYTHLTLPTSLAV